MNTRSRTHVLRLLGGLLILAGALGAIAAPAKAQYPWNVTLNGCVYTEANFAGNAYANNSACGGLRPLIADLVAEFEAAWSGTSGTSLEIGTGSKELVLITGRGFSVGMPVRIASTADPLVDFMDGTIVAWDATLRSMTVDVDAIGGSGTFTSWSVFVLRVETTVASSPVPVADGGTGSSTAAGAVVNLGITRVRAAVGRYIAPPGSPVEGWYIVGPGGDTGDWSAADENDWARWDGATWSFESPTDGDLATLLYDDLTNNSAPGAAFGLIVQYLGVATDWKYVSPIAESQSIPAGTTAMVYSGVAGYPLGSQLFVNKTASGAATYTLVSDLGLPRIEVRIRNTSASGAVAINVASGGSVSGTSSLDPDEMTVCNWIDTGLWRCD